MNKYAGLQIVAERLAIKKYAQQKLQYPPSASFTAANMPGRRPAPQYSEYNTFSGKDFIPGVSDWRNVQDVGRSGANMWRALKARDWGGLAQHSAMLQANYLNTALGIGSYFIPFAGKAVAAGLRPVISGAARMGSRYAGTMAGRMATRAAGGMARGANRMAAPITQSVPRMVGKGVAANAAVGGAMGLGYNAMNPTQPQMAQPAQAPRDLNASGSFNMPGSYNTQGYTM